VLFRSIICYLKVMSCGVWNRDFLPQISKNLAHPLATAESDRSSIVLIYTYRSARPIVDWTKY